MTHSVVIITKDRPRESARLIRALQMQTCIPDEILVIDAGHSFNIKADGKSGKVVGVKRIQSKAGIAIQRNLGLEHARGEIISFIDDDAVPEPDYCVEVLRAFADQPTVVGITGVQTNTKPHSFFERFFRTLFLVQRIHGRNKFRLSGFPELGEISNSTRSIEISSTCAFSFRASAVKDIRIPVEIFSGLPLGLSTPRCFGEDVWFSHELGKKGEMLQIISAKYRHNESARSREDAMITQSLYVYAMRILSHMVVSNPLQRACRIWALFHQGMINSVQTLCYRDTGYFLGYMNAMRAPLLEIRNSARKLQTG